MYFWRGTEIKWSQLTKKLSIFKTPKIFYKVLKNLGWVSEIRIEGSKKYRIPDPDPQYWKKRLCSGGEWVWGDPNIHPGSGSWFFTHSGSRIQGSKSTGSRIRICGSATLKKKILCSGGERVWGDPGGAGRDLHGQSHGRPTSSLPAQLSR